MTEVVTPARFVAIISLRIVTLAHRQTTSFIDNSIEAGILLGGNGAFTPWGSLSLSRARSLYDLV